MTEEHDDLFAWGRRYPRECGAKQSQSRGARECSTDAALTMRGRAVTLRAKVLQVLCAGPATADETAAVLGESALAVRPRFSELLALGRIAETEERRKNASGKTAVVWRLNLLGPVSCDAGASPLDGNATGPNEALHTAPSVTQLPVFAGGAGQCFSADVPPRDTTHAWL